MPRIIKNFDFKATQKANIGKSERDSMAALVAIVPQIEKLNIGDAIAIDVPTGAVAKSHLAMIRGKLVATMREGGALAGKRYRTLVRKAEGDIVLFREPDAQPLPKRVGGRPAGSKNKPKNGATQTKGPSFKESLDGAKKHLEGGVTVKDLTTGQESVIA